MQSISGISTSSLFAQNALKMHSNILSRTAAQISSGKRMVNAGIDPSGIAIASAMSAQLGGLNQAYNNTLDTSNLVRTADSALGSQGDVLNRMRDIAVRASNTATLSPADQGRLDAEFQSLKAQVTQSGQSSTFNGKQLTTDAAGGTPYGTQTAQVGPGAGAANQLDVKIDPSTAASLGIGASDVTSAANANQAITDIDTAISKLSDNRANLGITDNRLSFAGNDLQVQSVNMAASLSTIADTDLASAITERNQSSLQSQFALAALSKSKTQAFAIAQLLGV